MRPRFTSMSFHLHLILFKQEWFDCCDFKSSERIQSAAQIRKWSAVRFQKSEICESNFLVCDLKGDY
jgi:hypothetical protein